MKKMCSIGHSRLDDEGHVEICLADHTWARLCHVGQHRTQDDVEYECTRDGWQRKGLKTRTKKTITRSNQGRSTKGRSTMARSTKGRSTMKARSNTNNSKPTQESKALRRSKTRSKTRSKIPVSPKRSVPRSVSSVVDAKHYRSVSLKPARSKRSANPLKSILEKLGKHLNEI